MKIKPKAAFLLEFLCSSVLHGWQKVEFLLLTLLFLFLDDLQKIRISNLTSKTQVILNPETSNIELHTTVTWQVKGQPDGEYAS